MDARRKRRDQDTEYIRRDYKERYEEKEQRKRQEEKDKRKDQEEQDRIEKIRIREERKTEKEQRQQKVWKRKKEQDREIVMQGRKCFVCGGFGYIVCYYRNKTKIKKNRKAEAGKLECQPSSNKF